MAVSDIFDLKVNNQVKQDTPLDTFELDEQPFAGARVTPDTPAAEEESYLDKAIKRTEDVVAGVDPFTQQIMQRSRQTEAAREAAQRAQQSQQMTQAGLDTAFQQQAFQQSEAQRDTARAQEMGELATSLGERQDVATMQLAELGVTKDELEFRKDEIAKQNYKEKLSSIDTTSLSEDAYTSLLEEGKNIYGPDYNFDRLVSDQYATKLENVSSSTANLLLSKYGPQSGETIFTKNQAGDEVIDVTKIDSATKESLSEWYDAYTEGTADLFDESGELTETGSAWLTNIMNEIEVTELEKSHNEFLEELKVAYPDGGDQYEILKDWSQDASAAALVGYVPEFSSGTLADSIMVGPDGELEYLDETKYKSGGKNEDIGFYAVDKDDKLYLEDGSVFNIKDNELYKDGELYTGDDASTIKTLVKGKEIKDEIFQEVPEDVVSGEAYIDDDGKLMLNDSGQPLEVSYTNPQASDIKAVGDMSKDDLNKVGIDNIVKMISNYEGSTSAFNTSKLTNIFEAFDNYSDARELSKALNDIGVFESTDEAPYEGLKTGWYHDPIHGAYYVENDISGVPNGKKSSYAVVMPGGGYATLSLENKKGTGGGRIWIQEIAYR